MRLGRSIFAPALAALVLLIATPMASADAGPAHGDPVAPILLMLAVILLAAKLAGDLAARVGQPAVLGELLVGVLLGNLSLVGLTIFEGWRTDPAVDLLSRLGVVILLFEVGLESTVPQMMKLGLPAFVVASLGVAAPMLLGFVVGALLLPDQNVLVHLFLGATLCATSVGITARVFQDLGRSQSLEARLILGAAVIDDVFGLIILAVMVGMVSGPGSAGSGPAGIAIIVLKAGGFLLLSLLLGRYLSPRLFRFASRLRAHNVLLATALAFCFLLAWLANFIGLHPIVGAFAAGLILEEVHYKDLVDREARTLEHLVHPISGLLVPVFFVVMGLRTDLRAFAQPGVLGLAVALTVAAIAGKQICALGVLGSGADRLTVGLGMIPRGEVGLIFANIGLGLQMGGRPLLDAATFSAVVVMVIVTTVATPPLLKWSLGRAVGRATLPEPKEKTP
jgi:Kef-type K+ transport system membrane component KefB